MNSFFVIFKLVKYVFRDYKSELFKFIQLYDRKKMLDIKEIVHK